MASRFLLTNAYRGLRAHTPVEVIVAGVMSNCTLRVPPAPVSAPTHASHDAHDGFQEGASRLPKSFWNQPSTLTFRGLETSMQSQFKVAPVLARRYATDAKQLATRDNVSTEIATVEKELVDLVQQEIDFINAPEEGEDAGENISLAQVVKDFESETGFKISEDAETESVKMVRQVNGKTVTIQFASRERIEEFEDDDLNEMDEEGREHQHEEGEEHDHDHEGEGEEGENGPNPREHPFNITVASDSNSGASMHFGGYASEDGSYLVTVMSTEKSAGGKSKSSGDIAVGDLSEDLQQKIVEYLNPLGLSEQVVHFMFHYTGERRVDDAVETLQTFKKFLGR
eukprot:TRINITY_DN1317_c1_g1_i8.p1 TRINITY_DN1317_c1_g1~~TRINITY_DN1317_c1_g1_i8.p1  ORF type:complete len:361 (+),score=115.92 TRINITY_DN1317_c1_g1_i8:63-1085(+)